MRSCISVDRYSSLCIAVVAPEWISLVNRLLRAKQRPDPSPHAAGKLIWWKQGHLAAAANVRPNTLSDLMNNKRLPDIETLDKLATALEVPIFYMLMSEEQQVAFARGLERGEQESRDAEVKREMRDFIASRLDGVLDQLQTEFQAKAASKQPEEQAPVAVEVARKARRKSA